MSEDHIRYDILTQEALRGVIRKVLEETVRAGLPGDHHFFITFDTNHPGVKLSRRMQERYPQEMTIVVQHMFWNLDVGDTAFEIDLSFDETRERLRVPYASIRGFFDPSVKFGLQFDAASQDGAGDSKKNGDPAAEAKSAGPRKIRPVASVPSVAGDGATATRRKSDGKERQPPQKGLAGKQEAGKSASGAEVVSLDSFRKKD